MMVRRKVDLKEVDPVAEFVNNRERRLEASLARRNSKTRVPVARVASSGALRPASGGGSRLASSGSAVVLGGRRSGDHQETSGASSSKHKDHSKAFTNASRRWTVDLSTEPDQDDVLSPKWTKPVARRAINRLGFEDVAANLSRAPTIEDNGAEEEGTDEDTLAFMEISGKLHNLVNQAVMRSVKFFTKVRANHKDRPAALQEKQNFERLCSVSYLIATTNYRMSKWLWQLAPTSYVKPSKPQNTVDEHRTVDELLGEVQFSLSRMEVLATDLMPKLQKILSDAKKQKENPRFMLHQSGGNEPISPSFANPVKLAQRRGIRDVREMQGIMSHLERLLEVAHSLAYKPVGAAQVKVTATIIMAAARFKKGLQRRRARTAVKS
eukprot:TRINITY_DN84210_c0_g1_i1.p1 TRINITY_DN84210_c0_g1~~TRINITY_DN84210_c0_g1_i1.p1  ORF type:complete len:416 (-),score=77.64 TRINITY_DN84210_c0_g1_i1:75-1217(-)